MNGQVNNLNKENESTAKLSNTEWPGRPQKTTKVDDYRILSLVRKKPWGCPAKARTLIRVYNNVQTNSKLTWKTPKYI